MKTPADYCADIAKALEMGPTEGPYEVASATVYALNDEGFNRMCAQVQDARTPLAELHATAMLFAACHPAALRSILEERKQHIEDARQAAIAFRIKEEECERLKRRVAELEPDASRWNMLPALPEPDGCIRGPVTLSEGGVFRYYTPPQLDAIQREAFKAGRASASSAAVGERFFAFEFEIWQGGEMVASASGPREMAFNEAMGYACQYSQDGPVRVFEVVRHLVHATPPSAQHAPSVDTTFYPISSEDSV